MKFLPNKLSEYLIWRKVPSESAMKVRIEGLLLASKKPHPLLKVFIIGGVVWACSVYFLIPYVKNIQGEIALRPTQWAQMDNLVRLTRVSPVQSSAIEVLDDAELQKIRIALVARGIKPNILRLGADNPPRLEIQASDVLFSAVVDALEEMRLGWRIYPERVEIVSRPALATVNFSATLRQLGVSSDGLNTHAPPSVSVR